MIIQLNQVLLLFCNASVLTCNIHNRDPDIIGMLQEAKK